MLRTSQAEFKLKQQYQDLYIPNGDGTYEHLSGTVWITHDAGGGTSCDCRYCESWQGTCTNKQPDPLRIKTFIHHVVSGCSHFKLREVLKEHQQLRLF